MAPGTARCRPYAAREWVTFKVGDLPLADCALALGVGLIPVSILELTKLARRLWRRGKPENRVLPRLGPA